MDHEHNLTGTAQEWLRRIALNRPLVSVPNPIAIALIAIGFAQRFADGSLVATAAGRVHLDTRGIAHVVALRRSPARR
jgi:hypothetical protein